MGNFQELPQITTLFTKSKGYFAMKKSVAFTEKVIGLISIKALFMKDWAIYPVKLSAYNLFQIGVRT